MTKTIHRRQVLGLGLAAAAFALTGCMQDLGDTQQNQSLRIEDVRVTLLDAFNAEVQGFDSAPTTPIRGRGLIKSNSQFTADVRSAVRNELIPATANGVRPARIEIAVTFFELIDPRIANTSGPLSAIMSQLRVVDIETGSVLISTDRFTSVADGHPPGRILAGVPNIPAEQEYRVVLAG